MMVLASCRTTDTTRAGRAGLFENGSYRARAAPALGAATKATIDLSGRARTIRTRIHAAANITIWQDVTGTDDHVDGSSLETLQTVAYATIIFISVRVVW